MVPKIDARILVNVSILDTLPVDFWSIYLACTIHCLCYWHMSAEWWITPSLPSWRFPGYPNAMGSCFYPTTVLNDLFCKKSAPNCRGVRTRVCRHPDNDRCCVVDGNLRNVCTHVHAFSAHSCQMKCVHLCTRIFENTCQIIEVCACDLFPFLDKGIFYSNSKFDDSP